MVLRDHRGDTTGISGTGDHFSRQLRWEEKVMNYSKDAMHYLKGLFLIE